MNDQRIILLKLLAKAERCSKTYFAGGFKGRLQRLKRHPLKTVLFKLDQKLFKNSFVFPISARTFFDAPFRTLSCEEDMWLCGYKRDHSEIALTAYLIRTLEPDDIFFDLGAHHGFYTLLASLLASEVHAFEPAKRHLSILYKNIKAEKDVIVVGAAVGAREGIQILHEQAGPSSTLHKEMLAGAPEENLYSFHRRRVHVRTLDQYCKENNVYPTLIKMDIEGSEHNALLGAQTILEQKRPGIVMEIWRSPLDFRAHLKAVDLLKRHNYQPFRITISGETEKMRDIVPDRDIEPVRHSDNFLFLPL